jgi:hypothetical protein
MLGLIVLASGPILGRESGPGEGVGSLPSFGPEPSTGLVLLGDPAAIENALVQVSGDGFLLALPLDANQPQGDQALYISAGMQAWIRGDLLANGSVGLAVYSDADFAPARARVRWDGRRTSLFQLAPETMLELPLAQALASEDGGRSFFGVEARGRSGQRYQLTADLRNGLVRLRQRANFD